MSSLTSTNLNYSDFYNRANTGLRGCVERASGSYVDDFGNEICFWMAAQNLWARSYFLYHTSYTTGIGKDDIYIV